MPFCSQCGLKILPGFGQVCANGHPFVPADENEVSAAAAELEREFIADYFEIEQNYVLSEAAGLLLQAAHCCKNRDYDACTAVCRGSLESALSKLRIVKPSTRGIYMIEPAVLDLLPEIQFQQRLLVSWAKKNEALTTELAEQIAKVRELGNFASHLAERKHREIAHKLRESFKTGSYRLWVAPEEAYWALNVSRRTILLLLKWFANQIA